MQEETPRSPPLPRHTVAAPYERRTMTDTTTRRTPPAVRQGAHALAFLQTLTADTHRAPDVHTA